jgi:hypothetical protein
MGMRPLRTFDVEELAAVGAFPPPGPTAGDRPTSDPDVAATVSDFGPVAYFSPEFGVSASLPQYAGGLGVLAGDHLKAADALGIPLVGVGLFYHQGYFTQRVDDDGRQHAEFPRLDPSTVGLTAIDDVRVVVDILGTPVVIRVWHTAVGSIPLYLLAGLLLGEGSAVPLEASEAFISIGADVGVVLLLLLLGLEYSPKDLGAGLRLNWRSGVFDLAANLPIGVVAGLLLGWGPLPSLLLGGITYISSSGIIARLLTDLDRIGNRETPVVLSILVIEDLAMAVFLPIVAVLLVGGSPLDGAISVGVALAAVALALAASARWGQHASRVIGDWIGFYNNRRPHQALGMKTPAKAFALAA